MLAAAQLGVGWCRCGSSSYAGRPVGDALDYIVVRQARVELTVPLDDGRITLLAAACIVELGEAEEISSKLRALLVGQVPCDGEGSRQMSLTSRWISYLCGHYGHQAVQKIKSTSLGCALSVVSVLRMCSLWECVGTKWTVASVFFFSRSTVYES